MENFWLRWNLQEMGPRISQSEYNATVMPISMRTRPFSRVAAAACAPSPRVFTPESGNVKSRTLSTATARSHNSPPTCIRMPGLTSCQASRLQDKPRRRPDRFIRSQTVRRDTPIVHTSSLSGTAMSTPIRSSFQRSSNSSFQNYARRLPAVRMARTKQTARKDRDDQHRKQSQQEGDRRRDCSPTPPCRARPRSPTPECLECAFCCQINFSRRNHRRHLITRHKCRPDGTPATPADVEDAQRGDPVQPPKRDTKYKSREFVDTDSDDDTTPAASGVSTPSDKRSPSPPRGRRQM